MNDAVLSEPTLPVVLFADCGLAFALVEALGFAVFFALTAEADLLTVALAAGCF
ncbi:hypothetical protein N8Z55_05380 [Pseudomonadales bacterium]|nr:hypothetical protein [Pseudomonadales bacterium]